MANKNISVSVSIRPHGLLYIYLIAMFSLLVGREVDNHKLADKLKFMRAFNVKIIDGSK